LIGIITDQWPSINNNPATARTGLFAGGGSNVSNLSIQNTLYLPVYQSPPLTPDEKAQAIQTWAFLFPKSSAPEMRLSIFVDLWYYF
jgi:hypothetical protein